jgi:hypothetical protein
MAFTDVIDDYANGLTGTLTALNGTVGYSIISNVNTASRTGTDRGAQVTADGLRTVQVNFDQAVEGMTINVNRSNPGEIYFFEINGVQVNLNTAIASGDVVFTQTGPATHVVTPAGGVTSTEDPDNGSQGFFRFTIPVTSVKIFGTGGGSGNFDLFEIGIDPDFFTIVCFTADTKIQTPHGQVKVSDLKAGDMVTTQDGSARTVVMTHKRRVTRMALARETRLSPVRIAAGALGDGLPTEDLLVSRQHRILISSRVAKRICGSADVLVPAIQLVGLPGIDVDRTMQPVDYYHILLDRHDVVFANGAPAESLFVGPVSSEVLVDEVAEIDPEQACYSAFANMTPARPFPTSKQTKQIIAAHIKHQRPLLEDLYSLAS